MVTIAGKWHHMAGKVTVGIESHWPCVTDFIYLQAQDLTSRDERSTNQSITNFYGTIRRDTDISIISDVSVLQLVEEEEPMRNRSTGKRPLKWQCSRLID